ncbi:MAG: sulfatase, partial [bacterium]
VIAGYDSEINYVDKHVKRLLKNIPTGNTIVVITSDHGEEFREHGAWDHGTNLYNESIRIPLIISRPDRPHKIIPQPVSLLDLYPALLSRAGIPLPEKLDAQALPPREKRAVYSELAKRHRYGFISDPQKTIIKDRYKLHRNLSSGREELYDIVSDPGETQDISLKKPKIKNEMHILMDKLVSKEKRFKARLKYTETDKKTIKLLRSLGYIQ